MSDISTKCYCRIKNMNCELATIDGFCATTACVKHHTITIDDAIHQDNMKSNMRIQELMGIIHANEFIIKTAKQQIDFAEKEIGILYSNKRKQNEKNI